MRPIVLATDYGIASSYVGQLKCAIYKITPNVQVIDLIHDFPTCNSKASAYLLASYLEHIPENSIVIGVVDPGVGSNRELIFIEGDGYTFVGPNNGLFSIAVRKLSSFKISEIVLTIEPASKTFHGRDIFAPVAAQIFLQSIPKLEIISKEKFVGVDWPIDLYEIIYIDHFGNVISGITLEQINKDLSIKIKEHEIKYAETFYSVNEGECFWYRNSNGLLEIAAREKSAAEILELNIGSEIALL